MKINYNRVEETSKVGQCKVLQLVNLILRNQLELVESTAGIKLSLWDFSAHLVFVSNHKVKEHLQYLLSNLNDGNVSRETFSNAYSTDVSSNAVSAIIYPQIICVEEIYKFLSTDAMVEHNSESPILQIALNLYSRLFAKNNQQNLGSNSENDIIHSNICDNLNTVVEHLSVINNILKYKSVKQVLDQNLQEFQGLIRLFGNDLGDEEVKDFCQKIIHNLPNCLNQKSIDSVFTRLEKDVNFQSLYPQYQYIYQLVMHGEDHLLHDNLHKLFETSQSFVRIYEIEANIVQNSNSCQNITQHLFTSNAYYDYALCYLLSKCSVQNASSLVICDDELLAKKLFNFLSMYANCNHLSIELHGFSKVVEDQFVQSFLTFARIIFMPQPSVQDYIDLITDPILTWYCDSNHFKTIKMHGVQSNFATLSEICNYFEQISLGDSEEKDVRDSNLQELHSILLDSHQKASCGVLCENSFAAKMIFLTEAFKKLINIEQLQTRNLYQLQEKAYFIKLTSCNGAQFLGILEYLALNIGFKESSHGALSQDIDAGSCVASHKIVIRKSTNLIDVNHFNDIYIMSLDINMHGGISNNISLDSNFKYSYDPLLKLKNGLNKTNSLVFFRNNSSFEDEIVLCLLNIELEGQDSDALEKQILQNFNNSQIKKQNLIANQVAHFTKPEGLKIRSIFATSLRRLLNDPKSYFVQDILKLQPMDEFNSYSYKKNFGNICHDVLYETTTAYNSLDINSLQGDFAQDLWEKFDEVASKQFNEQDYMASLARVDQIAENVTNGLNFKADEISQETEISHTINIDGHNIRLRARVDRIEQSESDFCIIDYKTGILPTVASVTNFSDPQLVAEAYIMNQLSADSQNPYDFNVKLIKVNSNTKPYVEMNVNKILPDFEVAVKYVLKQYLIAEDAKF